MFLFSRLTWKEPGEILLLTSNSPQEEKFEREECPSVPANYSALYQNVNELSDSSWYQLCTKFQQGTRLSTWVQIFQGISLKYLWKYLPHFNSLVKAYHKNLLNSSQLPSIEPNVYTFNSDQEESRYKTPLSTSWLISTGFYSMIPIAEVPMKQPRLFTWIKTQHKKT